MTDNLTQPDYYQHPILGDTADYVKHMPYFQGAAFKYVLRAGNKPGVPAEHDLRKALECIHIINEKGIHTVALHMELGERTHEYFTSIKPRNMEENLLLQIDFWRAKSLREIASGFIDGYLENAINEMRRIYQEQQEMKPE